MEHLLMDYESVSSAGVISAYHAKVLEADWDTIDGLPDFEPPKTPWLGFPHDDATQGPLTNYPSAAGFNAARIWEGSLRESSGQLKDLPGAEVGRHAAALLQSWLFFGLIEAVLGKKVKVSYLVRKDADGIAHIYTRNLHFCLQARVYEIRQQQDSGRAQINTNIQLEMQLANKWVARIAHWSHPSFRAKLEEPYPGFLALLEHVSPAIVRLAEAVGQTRIHALPDFPYRGTLHWYYPWGALERRQSSLRALGWCDFQIRLMEDTLCQSAIDWIAAVGRGLSQEGAGAGHESCTRDACARNNIDEATYVQAHCCSEPALCTKLTPDLEAIKEAWRSDQIPVVSLQRNKNLADGELILVVGSSALRSPGSYVAVSHVWADGLGGATEKGLNLCQAQRLDRLCRSVCEAAGGRSSSSIAAEDPVWFWLDAACIPRPETIGRPLYYKALDGIRHVYSSARAVVVVDETVGRSTASTPTELLYARIYLSAWMQRMWTFEEAVLARELVFALGDGDLYIFKPHLTPPASHMTVAVVWRSLGAELHRLRVGGVAGGARLDMGHVARAFRFRLTNAPGEEFLSISGMLGLDTQRLMGVSTDRDVRAREFWLMLGDRVPNNILFVDAPRLAAAPPGFRWAPRTLMHPSTANLQVGSAVAAPNSRATEAGLVGTYVTVGLDLVLAASQGAVFYICTAGNGDGTVSLPEGNLSLLRVYCDQSWPEPPRNSSFDAILLPEDIAPVLSTGQWVLGAAARSVARPPAEVESSISAVHTEEIQAVFEYSGLVVVERIRNEELSTKLPTVMFPGSDKVVIHAGGVWSLAKILIT